MATGVHAPEFVEQLTWDIQRDAFAPPPTRRVIRGWDRAPVPAHAPRLHGHKVWKKVGLKVAHDEGSGDEAQEELLREGAGARKKSRTVNVRENIGDAIWVDIVPEATRSDANIPVENNDQVETRDAPSLSAKDANTMINIAAPENVIAYTKPATHPDIGVIPRKRTNTDRVITPRKPLRQTTLNHQAQPQLAGANDGDSPMKAARPRKSMRRSLLGVTSGEGQPSRRKSRAQSLLPTSLEQPLAPDGVGSYVIGQVLTMEEATASAPAFSQPSLEEAKISTTMEQHGVAEGETSRRSLRRSTAVQRRSTVNASQPPEPKRHGPDSTESGSIADSIAPAAQLVNSDISHDHTPPVSPFETNASGLLNDSDDSDADGIHIHTTGSKKSNESDTPKGHSQELRESNTDEVSLKVAPTTTTETPIERTISYESRELPMKADQSESPAVHHMQNIHLSEVSEMLSGIYDSALLPKLEAGMTKDLDIETNENTATAHAETTLMENPAPTSTKVYVAKDAALENEESLTTADMCVEAGIEAAVQQDNASNVEMPQAASPPSAALAEVLSSSIPVPTYDHDDTDMLRNFLTRVKANKAAKNPPKRKRSLPHSPLKIPLGDLDNNLSPSPQRPLGEPNITEVSPSKRKKRGSPLVQSEEPEEPRSCRRSGRTRLPAKEPPGAPSFIPVRRLGQEGDNTITLRRNEEKELAALTRVNTRKNKGAALTALEVLAKKSEEKEDPAMRQRLLKEVFDERVEKGKPRKGKDKKIVTWAEELAQFQTLSKGIVVEDKDEKEKEKAPVVPGVEEKKQGAMRVGVRSKATLGMGFNGTPAPKRKMRGRV